MAKEIGTNDLIDTWASGGVIIAPVAGKVDDGWEFEEQPPHEFMNWLQNRFGRQINYLMRSGVPEWSAATDYAVGSYVSFGGKLWGALTVNTNSEPSAGNTDWQAVPTSAELAAVAFTGAVTDLIGVTADAAELNVLDGAAITTAELNRLSGLTSNAQTQLNAKQALSNMLTAVAALGSTGLMARTGAGDVAARAILSANADIAVADGNAVSGNPTITARRLSQAEVQNNGSTVFGMTSGQREGQAFNSREQQIGVGQTWQNVAGSRNHSTTYTNNTGKPIVWNFRSNQDIDRAIEVSPDGSNWIQVARTSNASFISTSVVVPNGWRYRVNGSINFSIWAELR